MNSKQWSDDKAGYINRLQNHAVLYLVCNFVSRGGITAATAARPLPIWRQLLSVWFAITITATKPCCIDIPCATSFNSKLHPNEGRQFDVYSWPQLGGCEALLCNSDGRAAESQHAAQRRSTKNQIFNYRSNSATCVLSAFRLSQNSTLNSCWGHAFWELQRFKSFKFTTCRAAPLDKNQIFNYRSK